MACDGPEIHTPESEAKRLPAGNGHDAIPPPPPPEETAVGVPGWITWAPLRMGAWVLGNFPSVVLVGMLAAMLVYALANRGALRVLDLEAGNQMLALQLGHQLEAVSVGAQAGVD